MQSIELLLDHATETAVRSEWRKLHDVGLQSLARHIGDSNRPHITLLVAKRVMVHEPAGRDRGGTGGNPGVTGNPDVLENPDVLADIRSVFDSLPLPLTVGGLVVFGAARRGFVLARQVVVTDALLTLHRRVHGATEPVAASVVELSRPDSWTPHITLARRLSATETGAALDAIGAAPLEPGTATGARLWDGVEKTVTPLA